MHSPSNSKNNAQRNAKREAMIREEKEKADEAVKVACAAQNEKNQRELDEVREDSRKKAEAKKEELIQQRQRHNEELANLQAEINANVKTQLAHKSEWNKRQMENQVDELEKKQKEIEEKIQIRSTQLNCSSEIMRKGEDLRQDYMNRLREDKKEEQEEMNNKILELNQKLHEAKIKGEERLQALDEKRNEEQKNRLTKKEQMMLIGIKNTAEIGQSLALEDSFQHFKQQCKILRDKYRFFRLEYDEMQPELLKVHNRMKKGKPAGQCDTDDLRGALRVFHERATAFNAAGSTDEDNFTDYIAKVIKLIGYLTDQINSIQAKIDEDDDEDSINGKKEKGIGEELVGISDGMKEMSELIQLFNVIGRDCVQETLSIQMGQAHSSRLQSIQRPPSYDTTKKVKPAITEN